MNRLHKTEPNSLLKQTAGIHEQTSKNRTKQFTKTSKHEGYMNRLQKTEPNSLLKQTSAIHEQTS